MSDRCRKCGRDDCAVDALRRLSKLLDSQDAMGRTLKTAQEQCDLWSRRKAVN